MSLVNKIDLSIIIVSYKSKEHLKVLLPSIWESKGIQFSKGDVIARSAADEAILNKEKIVSNFAEASSDTSDALTMAVPYSAEVIIVDNDSQDGTAEFVEDQIISIKRGRAGSLCLVKNKNNGFSHGNNLGIKKSSGKYVLLLNPDTKLEPDTLQLIYDFMEKHLEIGIGGCKIIKPDGKLDLACRRRFPNPVNSFKRLFLLNNKDYNYSNVDENQSMEVDSLVGAFMLIRREVIEKIGLLDEKFFMYGEDLDYCWRCKESGFKVWYYPKTFITHYKGASSQKAAFKSLKWFHEAMWIFYSKHYKQKYPSLLNALVFFGINLRLYSLLVINSFKKEPRVSK